MTYVLQRQILCPTISHIKSTCLSQRAAWNDFNLTIVIQIAGVKNWKAPPTYDDIQFPPERRKLKLLDRAPQPPPGQRATKMFKRLIDMRGPEEVHNVLRQKQFGIQALTGGKLHSGHLDMIRLGINRKIDESRMFALWGIDAPWKPITKKGQGHRMGSGKGAIDHYVTPIKAGRIIIELGGKCEFAEVYPMLQLVAQKLPFKARPVCEEMLEEDERQRQLTEKSNMNPFNFQNCIENNMLGCRRWASPYDYVWYGKYR